MYVREYIIIILSDKPCKFINLNWFNEIDFCRWDGILTINSIQKKDNIQELANKSCLHIYAVFRIILHWIYNFLWMFNEQLVVHWTHLILLVCNMETKYSSCFSSCAFVDNTFTISHHSEKFRQEIWWPFHLLIFSLLLL